MKYEQTAKSILEHVGGSGNVNTLVHCATRLRFTLKDFKAADKAKLGDVKGVLQVVEAGGQLQVVIGTEVGEVYEAIQAAQQLNGNNGTTEPAPEKKGNFLDRLFKLFSGIFTPIVPVLAGAGILRGILTLITSLGWLDKASGTYTVLYAAADTVLYFLPLFLAITTARHFKVNEFIGLALAGSLLYPSILTAFNEQAPLDFLGIKVVLIKYASSVVPVIIAVFVLSKLDQFLRKRMPSVIRSFAVPMLDLVIMVPLTMMAIGPIFTTATNLFTDGFLAIYSASTLIFGFVFALCWHPLVVFGLHRGFIPINLNNLATTGRDPLLAITMPSNFAQTGASLGVAVRSKNKDFKAIAGSNVIAGLFGVTEPIIYGVTLKTKTPFYYSCLMAGIGGAIIASAGSYAIGLPAGGVLATPVFAEHALMWYIFAICLAFVGSFLLTVIFGFKDVPAGELDTSETAAPVKEAAQPAANAQPVVKTVGIAQEIIVSPLQGKTVNLKDISDEAFSSLALGKGIAIIPTEGKVIAPFDGVVIAAYRTGHAVGVKSDSGAEILVHVGLETVKLKGEGYQLHVTQDQRVKQGDVLVTFDIDLIKSKGFDISTPVIVTNTHEYADVLSLNQEAVSFRDNLLTAVK